MTRLHLRLLLDTNVAIWLVAADPRGGDAVGIAAQADDIFVSVVSLVEIAIKNQLPAARDPFKVEAAKAAEDFAAAGFRVLPLAQAHALVMEDLPPLHGDPFDRMLAAQARAEGLRLLTGDRTLAGYDPAFIFV